MRKLLLSVAAALLFGCASAWGQGCFGGATNGYAPAPQAAYYRDPMSGRLYMIRFEEIHDQRPPSWPAAPTYAPQAPYATAPSFPYFGGNGNGGGTAVYQNGGRARVVERSYRDPFCPTCP